MAAPKSKTKLEREQHLATVSLLHMRGREQWEIGKLTGRSQGQISKDIKAVEKKWLEQQTTTMETVKARLAVTLTQLASEAWDVWTDTKDSRHFANALAATRDLRALVGADAPRKTESKVEGSVEVRHVEELSDTDLDDIARGDFEIVEGGAAIVRGRRVALPALGTD